MNNAQFRSQRAGPNQELRYALVPLNQSSVALLGSDEPLENFPASTQRLGTANGLIGIGDQVSITVFESGSGGLFLPREGGTRAGNFVTVPTQQVGKDGTIAMPYVGMVHVAGSSPRAVSATLQQQRRTARWIQVVVTVADRYCDLPVSVLGDTTNATHFSLDPGGARILEAIARAGGPKFPAYSELIRWPCSAMAGPRCRRPLQAPP